MAGARNAVKILPGTRFIHKWPTSFTKTDVEARKHRAVLLDSHLTAMLESSSFGHHCFLHRNNPAWLLTASAKATDYPNSGPRFRKRHGSFNTFFSGGTDILQYLDAQTEQNHQLCEGIYCDSMTLHSKHLLQIQPHHPSAKSQPEPLVPGFTLDHRHRPGLRVADGAHVSCCAQHVAEHVLEDEVCGVF